MEKPRAGRGSSWALLGPPEEPIEVNQISVNFGAVAKHRGPPPQIKPSPQSNPKTLVKHGGSPPQIKPSPQSNPKTFVKHGGPPKSDPKMVPQRALWRKSDPKCSGSPLVTCFDGFQNTSQIWCFGGWTGVPHHRLSPRRSQIQKPS